MLTVLTRGYLFANADENPGDKIDYAHQALSAPGAVSRTKRTPPLKRTGSSKAISENCMGWFYRHAHNIAQFMKNNPDKVSKTAHGKTDIIDREFDTA